MKNKDTIIGATAFAVLAFIIFCISFLINDEPELIEIIDDYEVLIMEHDLNTDELLEVGVPFSSMIEYTPPKPSVDDIECIALNIYHEARGDNYAGKAAVADVVLNRVNDSRYPNTICEVVYDAKLNSNGLPRLHQCQFSWYCDGSSDIPRNTVAYLEALNIATQILSSNPTLRGITEGATHYHAFYITPYWTNDRGMHVIGRIGDHVFYKWY